MARLVTHDDLNRLVTNVGDALELEVNCSKGQLLRVSGTNKVTLVNNVTVDSLGKVLGVALRDGQVGNKVGYQFLGSYTMPTDQGWSAGQPIYFTNGGDLTSTPPVYTIGNFIQVVGVALNSDTVFLFRESPYPFD